MAFADYKNPVASHIPFMHTMYSTHFLPAGFQLVITLLLTIAPLISATTPSPHPGLDPVINKRGDDQGLPEGWRNSGCYTDDPAMRTLTSLTHSDSTNMTVMNCIEYCIYYDKSYAGLENGLDCYCGNTLTSGSTNAPNSDCTSACTGNLTQNCGGPHSLNLYWNGLPPQPSPVMVKNPRNWYLMGCYSDSNDARTLSTPAYIDGRPFNDAEYCILTCIGFGYSFAGMEFANECWCGDHIGQDRKPVDQMYCPLACPGNSLELCGGHNGIVIYSATKPPG